MPVTTIEKIFLNCRGCGAERPLYVSNARRGFIETGWRVDFSERDRFDCFCAACAVSPLQKQKEYLDHIFEAQYRFGE
ncbi:MAG: hypothetical protein JSS81_16930 [Acidobacteria bacterium]|nr:hypothetical protein [Acidobacteriota bacterium]